ncbi:MAG TPA: YebC/PmpR family DNA-binding transcriptional regulator [Candidatus Gastranaerophilales bacterium]|nr:YebC/PmpR family DNA-binding transcriptional regulator [Candidatus Gastranaerophilales bacterium]
MSGHSKWANIKHRKAKVDAQKGAAFAKFAREIMLAAKEGGVDPDSNFRLRTAIDKAKAEGLPNDNITRAIDKASGAMEDSNLESIIYEGYGAGGVAILVETLTDNRNRTAGDIRSYFNKFSGNLGETGCVGWIFKPEGIILIAKQGINQDNLFECSINAGAEDFILEEEDYKIITAPESLQSVAEELEKAGFKIKNAEITRNPSNTVNIEDEEIAKKLLKLLDNIESHDDVQNVYANFEIDDDLLENLG